jgi:hypothetical protein
MFPSALSPDPAKAPIIDARVEVNHGHHALPGHLHREPPPFEPEIVPSEHGTRELPRYRGGWTVQRYGSHSGVGIGDLLEYDELGEVVRTIEAKGQGIDAVQLEFGRNWRNWPKIKETGRITAEAVAGFCGQFLARDREVPKAKI